MEAGGRSKGTSSSMPAKSSLSSKKATENDNLEIIIQNKNKNRSTHCVEIWIEKKKYIYKKRTREKKKKKERKPPRKLNKN